MKKCVTQAQNEAQKVPYENTLGRALLAPSGEELHIFQQSNQGIAANSALSIFI